MTNDPSFAERPAKLRVSQTVVIGPLSPALSEEVAGWNRLKTPSPEEHAEYLHRLGLTAIKPGEWNGIFAVVQGLEGTAAPQYVDVGREDFGTFLFRVAGDTNALPDPSAWPEEGGVHFTPDLSNLEDIVEADPRYRAAIEMDPDELWVDKNNGNRPHSAHYIQAHQHVRCDVVRSFYDGSLYSQGYEAFCDFLKAQHAYLALAGTHQRPFFPNEVGTFDTTPYRRRNPRLTEAKVVRRIASQYGDPYGQGNRLEQGTPNGESVSEVNLPGIDTDNLPYDVVRYDELGERKLMYPEYQGYTFFYPPGTAIDQYLKQVWTIGLEIEQGIKNGGDKSKLLELIARQYQYAANARPFVNINNSLSMHLVNTQVKLLGYGGMTHGEMDHAAQRMQPDNFVRYFADRATGSRE